MLPDPQPVSRPEPHWLTLPAATLLLLACCVSIMASGRLTLRLVLPSLIYGAFVPLLQILSLAVVCGPLPWRRAVALFFRGHTPWTTWLIGSAALWGVAPTLLMFRYGEPWRLSALVPAAWSLVIDYRYFRKTVGGSKADAARRLALQRAICWIPGALWFVAPAGWQFVLGSLGL